MPNRVYTDFNELRRQVNDLIDRRKVRVHRHARKSHPEISELEQIAIVRYGGPIRPDKDRNLSEGVYLCWATLQTLGRCRGLFCIEETSGGDLVLIITAFQE